MELSPLLSPPHQERGGKISDIYSGEKTSWPPLVTVTKNRYGLRCHNRNRDFNAGNRVWRSDFLEVFQGDNLFDTLGRLGYNNFLLCGALG